ncbi:MAG: hypothetical protein ACYCO9_21860 [Streptosporangiaceae bacterium]
MSLAAIRRWQLLLIFALERTSVLRRLTKRVFLQVKDSFADISGLFGDEPGSAEADRTEDVLRVTDLISALFGSALNLVVGAAAAIAIIGTQTHQRPEWMVAGAYPGGICVVGLIVLHAVILLGQVRDYAGRSRVPRSRLLRGVRNAVSPRTPGLYKLIVTGVPTTRPLRRSRTGGSPVSSSAPRPGSLPVQRDRGAFRAERLRPRPAGGQACLDRECGDPAGLSATETGGMSVGRVMMVCASWALVRAQVGGVSERG